MRALACGAASAVKSASCAHSSENAVKASRHCRGGPGRIRHLTPRCNALLGRGAHLPRSPPARSRKSALPLLRSRKPP
jgi:hypothetical protein